MFSVLFVPIFHCNHDILMTLNVIKSSFKTNENKTMYVITRLSRVNCLGYRSIRRPLADTRQLKLPEENSIVWNAKLMCIKRVEENIYYSTSGM